MINSVTIAEILRKYEKVHILLLGGEMSHHGNCHDYYTVQMMQGIRVDKAFLSHAALSIEFGASIHNSAVQDYDLIVTDEGVSADFIEQLREKGVEVDIIAAEMIKEEGA